MTWNMEVTKNSPKMCCSSIILLYSGEESVFLVSAATAAQIKHIHFQKREQKSISTYPKRPALMQLVCKTVSTHCHMGRGLAGTCSMTTVRRGYTLQFARRPPRLRGVLTTTVCSEDTQVLRAEVMNPLEKVTIEIVPPAQSESGFYSRYFLVPKKTAACDLF